MIDTDSRDRLTARIAEITARGIATDVTPVRLFGYVGGTEYHPIEWSGYGVRYVMNGETRYSFWPEWKDGNGATYVIDGIGHYVAGWHVDKAETMLNPITRITNVKTGHVSDFLIRPTRRAYVLWTSVLTEGK